MTWEDKFRDMPAVFDVLECLGLPRTEEAAHHITGRRLRVAGPTVLDVAVQAGLIKSKGQFRKNPQRLSADGQPMNPDDPWPPEASVIVVGKRQNGFSVSVETP